MAKYYYKSGYLNLKIGNTPDSKGVVVIETNKDSNLLMGDIITEVNRELISDSNNFINLVKEIKKTGRNSLLLKILREEQSLWITIQFIK